TPRRLFDETEGRGLAIDLLVNNAGFGTRNHFVDIPWERTEEQLRLNLVSLTELSWLFAREMVRPDRGAILNVASTTGCQPVPTYATYSAGKAYVRMFSQALAHELRRTRVRVTCVCPGPTATEFAAVAGHDIPFGGELVMMSARRCVSIALRALGWA